ncbi:bifunctional pyr operon transcriptional regulator/uracil phosphoribosyltransferase [Boudabousia tangfeifanii]|uniref:Bifunctional protein PyrR n=1 Tax=Boudabousia tangfeifanii TaxID=1912795 RepID=A0A1D9MKA9_9ACTO|nr:bifunctional pyr operon transcriptional regulator/uracil phosphoribosyltransferase PyrR [Boudabousia tangfeifanii]AOZ72619.1 bifunctional pyr operon transcriptional regulator/uracil phosphoribosyltransferase [Boudabousia tangfeifanii]
MAPLGRRVLGEEDIRRSLKRISYQIIEKNRGAEKVVLMGIHTRGVHLAKRIAQNLAEQGENVPAGALDISGFRDDRDQADRSHGTTTLPEGGIDDCKVVLVDDVLYTGRTVRAALDALSVLGRPSAVQLAVLVDRGHRELPIRADFVGKNLPTARSETVAIKLEEIDSTDGVFIIGGQA